MKHKKIPMTAASDPDAALGGACGEKHEKSFNFKTKKAKAGIIYLSTVPYLVTVRKLRELLSQYGEIGRIFLQPEIVRNAASGKKRKRYTEGWVEFKDRRIGKRVAVSLNNTMVGGKRRSKSYEAIWNIRYLHKFKWLHLTEQLSYESAVRKQKLRTIESQAKRESNYFQQQIEKGENLKKLEETVLKKGGLWEKYQLQIRQRSARAKEATDSKSDHDLLNDMFG